MKLTIVLLLTRLSKGGGDKHTYSNRYQWDVANKEKPIVKSRTTTDAYRKASIKRRVQKSLGVGTIVPKMRRACNT